MDRSYLLNFFLFSFFSFFSFNVISQPPIGKWAYYLSFDKISEIETSKSFVFGLGERAVLVYDKKNNSISSLSKLNGLSDINPTTIKFIPEFNILFVGYKNGNIDLIKDNNEIINIPYIKDAEILSDKTIYDAFYFNNQLYISCGFGIIVFNLMNFNIVNTLFIGEFGQSLSVYSLSINFKNEEIIAATDKGLYRSYMYLNLANYNNWTKININPHSNVPVNKVVHFGHKTFYLCNNELYFIDNYTNNIFDTSFKKVKTIKVEDNFLIVVLERKVIILDSLLNVNRMHAKEWFTLTDAIIDKDKNIWVSDFYNCICKIDINDIVNCIKINGPSSNTFFSADITKDKLWLVKGGISPLWHNLWYRPEINVYLNNNKWVSINEFNDTILKKTTDLCFVKVNKKNTNQVLIGSFGGGLILFDAKNMKTTKIYSDTNSCLQSVIPSDLYVRVTGIDVDEGGNIWVANSEVEDQIGVLTTDGRWKCFSLSKAIGTKRYTGKLLITSDGTKWIILQKGGGLALFNENNTLDNTFDDKMRALKIIDKEGDLVSNEVHCLVEDKNKYVWVGTSNGLVYYDLREDLFSENLRAYRIKLPNEIQGQANYLFEAQTITAIEVDGFNNKWIAVKDGGVFLMNSDCSKKVFHFNTENSPLLSNNVIDIKIEPYTGEVFFITDVGLCSFRGYATEGNEKFSNVTVFPNPVKNNYDGLIAIRGLVNNAFVKITDISGNLVFETIAQGGQAVWNGRNLSGQKVKTGIYLIFATNQDGSESFVSKILIVD